MTADPRPASLLLPILAMALVVVASNILVQFVIAGGLLTWGAFTYPLAFLVTDLTNRLRGARAARAVVLWGFAAGLLCSLVGTQVEIAPGVAAVPLRVAVASGTAFLVAQLLDVAVFDRLRRLAWWRAPLVSSLLGSTVDTAVFFALAFSAGLGALFPAGAVAATAWGQEAAPLLGLGPAAPLWLSLAVADWGVKVALAVLTLLPFRLLVGRRPSSVA